MPDFGRLCGLFVALLAGVVRATPVLELDVGDASGFKGGARDCTIAATSEGTERFVRIKGHRRDAELKWPQFEKLLPKPVKVGTPMVAKVRFRASTHFKCNPFFRFAYRTPEGKVKRTDFQGLVADEQLKSFPLGTWIERTIPVPELPNVAALVFMVNVETETIPFDFTLDLARFSVETVELDAEIRRLREEWTVFRKGFKPDGSDGSNHLLPTEGHRFQKPFDVVRDGKPACRIAYATGNNWQERLSTPTTRLAAEELQFLVERLTGVKLPINSGDAKLPTIHVGKGEFRMNRELRESAMTPILLKLAGSDGYAIKRFGDDLYVFGTCEKGALNGVYALVENNSDIIFVRPNREHGIVCSKRESLSFVWGENVVERPRVNVRGFWNIQDFRYWNANYSNAMSYRPWTEAVPFARGGHNVNWFAGDFKEHPEHYGLVNGERKPYGNMLCFANPELKEHFADRIVDRMAAMQLEEIAGIDVSLDDSMNWCECPKCTADITLDNGEVVRRTDPDFMSTQYFLVLNHAAKKLSAAFPGKRLVTLAYFQTAEPPRCGVAPNIDIVYCPYYRANDTNPVFCDENLVWLERLKRWRKKLTDGQDLRIYGYNGLGLGFPRPLCHTHQRDFREYFKYCTGMVGEGSATIAADEIDAKTGEPTSTMKVMDWSAIEFWVMMRLYWNPDADVEQLYKRFCVRAFREAARPMERFYGILRAEWFRHDIPSGIGETGVTATKVYVIEAGHEAELRACLEQAAAAATDPDVRWLVGRVRERFESFVSAVKDAKTSAANVPLVKVSGEPGFDDAAWRDAAKIDGFHDWTDPRKPAKAKSVVMMMQDQKRLYLRGVFFEDVAKTDSKRNPYPDREEVFGSSAEIFLGDNSTSGRYYLFRIDTAGNVADYIGTDPGWNRKETKVAVKKGSDRWEWTLTVPLKEIGMDIIADNTLKAAFIREMHCGKGNEEYSSWQWCRNHQMQTFGTLTLQR